MDEDKSVWDRFSDFRVGQLAVRPLRSAGSVPLRKKGEGEKRGEKTEKKKNWTKEYEEVAGGRTFSPPPESHPIEFPLRSREESEGSASCPAPETRLPDKPSHGMETATTGMGAPLVPAHFTPRQVPQGSLDASHAEVPVVVLVDSIFTSNSVWIT